VPLLHVFSMRRFFRILGNLLVLTAFMVGASFFLRTGGGSAPASEQIEQLLTSEQIQQPPVAERTPVSAPPAVVPIPVPTTLTPEARLPITLPVIASIDLNTDVVPAPLVESNGVRTWLVPAFKAGHLEDTAGAGRGNAVLMAHVSSLHSGDVFKNLDRVQVGDEVEVFMWRASLHLPCVRNAFGPAHGPRDGRADVRAHTLAFYVHRAVGPGCVGLHGAPLRSGGACRRLIQVAQPREGKSNPSEQSKRRLRAFVGFPYYHLSRPASPGTQGARLNRSADVKHRETNHSAARLAGAEAHAFGRHSLCSSPLGVKHGRETKQSDPSL
jgi:hypothetical protein